MKQQEFDIEVERAFLRSKKLLNKKAEEYAKNNIDRLNQFYRSGASQNIPATQALFGMADKHVTSIADMVKEPHSYSLKKWNEKLTDLRNYTVLLDALVRDIGIT